MTVLVVVGSWVVVQNAASASNVYDSRVMQRMKFSSNQRGKVRAVLKQSDREMAVIFRKYGINPNAKPVFEKLRQAGSELKAVESREKRKMKKIMSAEQYKFYLALLQDTAARVIKASRNKP